MFSRIFLAILIGTCSLAYADVSKPVCTQTGPTEYRLSYTLTGGAHEVEIFASTAARGGAARHLVARTTRTHISLHAGVPGERIYFFLKPDKGKEREVSVRRLPLSGTPNFRDLGGYETTDGRFVRWGLLYRSGVLTGLTASDLLYLQRLGVRVVCDFRTPDERAASPEKWVPGSDTRQLSVPIGMDSGTDLKASMQHLLAGNPPPEELRRRMNDVYRHFAIDGAPEFATVIKQLEDDHLPLVYHCTAGKDRTGVFSALLLLLLGVPERTVFEDYTLSNRYFADASNHGGGTAHAVQKTQKAIGRLSLGQRAVLLEADPGALKSALDAIHDRYGSLDNYRRKALGISDEDLQKLRMRLLSD